MSLSLNAEQKELLKIFKIEEKYIIPPYQRPYSWEYEQCFQLYSDIMSGYAPLNLNNSVSDDYFIGNIIIAKSDEDKKVLEVIDGQQRLTTLFLLFKVLFVLQPQLTILKEILESKDWMGNFDGYRIESKIIETNDADTLLEVFKFDIDMLEEKLQQCIKKGNFLEKECKNRFEQNILLFYYWLKDFQQNNSLEDFTKYLLSSVYMLPIELSGKTQEEAKDKALVIFETINNRGMNLEDADIFKAKLYKS